MNHTRSFWLIVSPLTPLPAPPALSCCSSDLPAVQKRFVDNPSDFLRGVSRLDKIAAEIGDHDVSNSLLDAQGVTKFGIIGQRYAQQLTKTSKIDIDEMMSQFRARFGSDVEEGERAEIDWYKFGRAVVHRFRGVSCTSFMKGILGLQAAVKERKATVRRRKDDDDDDDVPVQRAVQLDDTSREASSMTDRRVVLLFHHLPLEPLPFFDVLLHPTSFTQSIENLFDLTFLVKKGQAEVTIDEEMGIPVVRRIGDNEFVPDDEEDGAGRAGGATEPNMFQCIIKMDRETYDQLLVAFDLVGRKPFLPDRTKQYAEEERHHATHADDAARRGAAAASSSAAAAASSSAAAATPAAASSAAASSRGTKRRSSGAPAPISAYDKLAAHFTASQPTLRDALLPPESAKKARRTNTRNSAASSARRRRRDEDEESEVSEEVDDEEEEEEE